MAYINKVISANAEYEHQQTDIMEFMKKAGALENQDARRLGLLYNRSAIKRRYSVLPDFTEGNIPLLFKPGREFPTVADRMAVYEEQAPLLAEKLLKKLNGDQDFSHIITVSCTGMLAPGLDLELVERLGLPDTIQRTSVNFMGCYAAIHALKMADAFCCQNPAARVLVVCVELCTLHFQRDNSPDYQTSNMLFGDGAAAAIVSGQPTGLEIRGFFSKIALQGKQSMSWRISNHGFIMTLSPEVPKHIQATMASMMHDACGQYQIKKEEIDFWAVHPGGKSILEAVNGALNLEHESLNRSYETLSENGNMSSCTVLFVIEKMWPDFKNGQNCLAMGFGPGLTLETALLRYV